MVRTVRVNVRTRRPRLPHFGQGAFLGAQWTGITIDVGASVPMLVSLVMRLQVQPHSPGHKPYRSRAKRITAGRPLGGDQRGVSKPPSAVYATAFSAE